MSDDQGLSCRNRPFRPQSRCATTASISPYALLVAYFSIEIPEFRTWNNALLILLQVSVIGIIAVGMTFHIITAGIDLSVGSLLAVAGIVSGLFAQKDPTPFNVIMAFAAADLGRRCSAGR